MNKELLKTRIVIPCYNEANRLDEEKYNYYLKIEKKMI